MPRIVNFGTGLDNSGLYAVNYFWNSGVIFGRNVFYSYGPLGFLCYTMNVGHNIILSLLFWGMITLFLQYCGIRFFLRRILYADGRLAWL